MGGIILKPYIIKRILSAIPLLLIISFVCFVFINLIPSDPAEVALRVRQVPIITEDAIAEVRAELGLDKPYLVRYFTSDPYRCRRTAPLHACHPAACRSVPGHGDSLKPADWLSLCRIQRWLV